MIPEQFQRVALLLGQAALARLAAARVAVIGLGAVGSHATEALARAGVGHLRLVDFDVVNASNINRQLLALHSTVGRKKVDLAAARVRDINPDCDVQPLDLFLHVETIPQVVAPPLDLVIDAIDSFRPKVELLAACRQRGVPVISSMGAAMRTDPLGVRISLLRDITTCRLATRVRKALRRRGVSVDFECVHSVEPPGETTGPATAASLDSGVPTLQRGRARRPLGSLPTITGIFGLTIAHRAIERLVVLRGSSHLAVQDTGKSTCPCHPNTFHRRGI
ncbi:MAG: ThiF family adenylyltransferase [Tepidisphaerales bacterium]